MASAKQIAWRKKFAKLYGKKKKGSKKSKLHSQVRKTPKAKSERKYMIIRFYRDKNTPSKVIRRNLTLAQARKHTNDPKTRQAGVWFDGYDEQDETMIGGSSHGMDRPNGDDW